MRPVHATAMALGALLASAGSGEARLPNPSLPLPDMRIEVAVHIPTGCLSMLVFDDDRLSAARIVDADCLPRGVRSRPIPASVIDFAITPAT